MTFSEVENLVKWLSLPVTAILGWFGSLIRSILKKQDDHDDRHAEHETRLQLIEASRRYELEVRREQRREILDAIKQTDSKITNLGAQLQSISLALARLRRDKGNNGE